MNLNNTKTIFPYSSNDNYYCYYCNKQSCVCVVDLMELLSSYANENKNKIEITVMSLCNNCLITNYFKAGNYDFVSLRMMIKIIKKFAIYRSRIFYTDCRSEQHSRHFNINLVEIE